ncbi:MAG: site-specific recombinase [Gammaproteobacteria bacterium]|nr:site-specific recombinase [Gammaproteobacteria bacterium]
MQDLQDSITPTNTDNISVLRNLVRYLRPLAYDDVEQATQNIHVLCYNLQTNDPLKTYLRQAILELLRKHQHITLLTETGIFSETGFFSETTRRIAHHLLPDVINHRYLQHMIGVIFNNRRDWIWVKGVENSVWLTLLEALELDKNFVSSNTTVPFYITQLREALRILSYRISAIGLDAEIIHLAPELEEETSAFLAQNIEIIQLLNNITVAKFDISEEDTAPSRQQLQKCDELIAQLKLRAHAEGTSLSLTLKLLRLRQHLKRIDTLLDILTRSRHGYIDAAYYPSLIQYFKDTIHAECHKNALFYYWQENIAILALRITESTSNTGEHYITESRREYFVLFQSALIAGFIVAFMAMTKISVAGLHLAPLNETIAYCLIYGLGFVLIHLLHGTVATKQPAMTANTIAASLNQTNGAQQNLEGLVTLIARTSRSQLIAIIGNVIAAISITMALALLVHYFSGEHFISDAKAYFLLSQVTPFSGALFYAAIAGVCLFLSGLVAGYYDNLASYNKIPQRLLQLEWPKQLLGEARVQRIANYIAHNLGALAGNFSLGCMLGGVWSLGVLFGLPLDIRHVTFSSAFIAFSFVTLDFNLHPTLLALTLLGVAGIAFINLTVSFSLSLYVALRARQITFAQSRQLINLLGWRFLKNPGEFIFPPK